MATTAGEFPFTIILEDSRSAETRQSCTVTAKLPAVPDLRIVVGSGSTNIPVDIAISKPYSLPITGDLVLTTEPNTGAADGEVNKKFRLNLPLVVDAAGFPVPIASLKAQVANRLGATPPRDVRRCN